MDSLKPIFFIAIGSSFVFNLILAFSGILGGNEVSVTKFLTMTAIMACIAYVVLHLNSKNADKKQ